MKRELKYSAYVLFSLLLVVTSQLFSQTTKANQKTYLKSSAENKQTKPSKRETEKWILEKLKKYTISNETSYNYKFSFEGSKLIIKSIYIVPTTTWKSDYTTIVDLKDLDKIYFNGPDSYNPLLIFKVTANSNIIEESRAIDRGISKEWEVKTTSLLFQREAESDLEDRLNKAFKTLKSFYVTELF